MNRINRADLGLMLLGIAVLVIAVSMNSGIAKDIATTVSGILLGFSFFHLVFGKTDP